MLIDRSKSLLLVVDIQERLAPAVEGADAAIKNTAVLAKSAQRLGVPVFFSEQYPRGLGPTVPELEQWRQSERVLEKVHFSCASDPALLQRLRRVGRRQVVITGMEAHVCVLQTAFGLKDAGMAVFVVGDAVASRHAPDKYSGLARMSAAGIAVVTTEMVVFEWLHQAATDEFRELVQLIK